MQRSGDAAGSRHTTHASDASRHLQTPTNLDPSTIPALLATCRPQPAPVPLQTVVVRAYINSTVAAGLIKLDERVGTSRKYACYVPFWG